MSNLLRAGFARLFRDKVFWICNAVLFLLGVYISFDRYLATVMYDSIRESADNIVFVFLGYGGVFYAIFNALFIGREYSDGAIRNKFIIGHTRVSIYISNLIVAAVGNIMITLAYTLPAAAISIPALGWFEKPTEFIVVTFIALLILSVAYAAVFTALSLLNTNKAVNAVVCMSMALLLLVAAVAVRDALGEPESFYYGYTAEIDDNGEVHEISASEMPNPYYIGGMKRTVCKAFIDVSPGGQSMQLTMFETDAPEILALYSVGITAAATAIGLVLFKRKDIK